MRATISWTRNRCKDRLPRAAFTPATTDLGVPDFLLGDVSTASFTTPTVVHNYKYGNSFFAQDSWRATQEPHSQLWNPL